MWFIMINLFQLQLDDVLWNGDILPFRGRTDHLVCIVNILLQIINQNCRSCLRMDGQTLVMIFCNNANSGPSGKFLHLLSSKQTTLAYDVLDFSLILSYVIPISLVLHVFLINCTNFLITV